MKDKENYFPKKEISNEMNKKIKDRKEKEQEEESRNEDTDIDFTIVGIGASAGGLESLEKFFKALPTDNGMAFVIVQHLSPDYKSLMVELLSKHTNIPVHRIEDSVKVKPNNIYLIPPKKTLIIFHGKLLLTEMDSKKGLTLPINIFFRSLAEDMGKKAVGIILSGTGSDGTLGIREIKGAGGLVMAQDLESAKFDGMPKSAVATGLIDYVLPPHKMPEVLLRYTKHPYIAGDNKEDTIKNEDDLTKILAEIRTRKGVDFTYYKPNTVIRRIKRRVSLNQIDSIKDYVRYLKENPNEVDNLYNEMLIGVTNFFRDQEAFEILKEKVIPKLFENKNPGDSIRIWVSACSTGEETYSVAMIIKEYLELVKTHYDVKIFASDIDEKAIKIAGAGVYSESILGDISKERLRRFFVKKGSNYQVAKEIRSMILFTTHNVIKDAPFSNVDLITCRNLLIYLEPVMQKKILSLFHFSLIQNGFLFLGPSETIGDMTDSFSLFNSKWKFYKKKGVYKKLPSNVFNVPDYKPLKTIKREEFRSNDYVSSDLKNYELIYKAMFDDYLPPTIVINENFELLHVFGDANKYLKFPSGKISYNIKNIIVKDLLIAISTAVHKISNDEKKVVYKDITIKNPKDDDKNEIIRLNLIINSIFSKITQQKLIILSFEEIEDNIDNGSEEIDQYIESYNIDDKVRQHILDLEQELNYTKENLQATIEELETSNEELQSTNEELLASNEELQSTNEELQSVNEELYTVNAEYQSKIEELTELNNDINYLLATIEIGIIFLDLNLCVRKYTPVALKVINLLKIDIGRPINHINNNIVNLNINSYVEKTLKDRIPVEKEIYTNSDEWYLMKIHPHYSSDGSTQGINVIFIDITDIKKINNKLKKVNKEYEESLKKLQFSDVLISNYPNGFVLSFDRDFNVISAKGRGLEDIKLSESRITDRNLDDIFDKDMVDKIKPLMVDAFKGKENKLEIQINQNYFTLHCLPIVDEYKEINRIMLLSQNITQHKEMTKEIKKINTQLTEANKQMEKFLFAIENIPNIIMITDPKGNIEYVNNKFLEITGYSKDEVINKNPSFIKHASQNPEDYENMWETINQGKNWKGEFTNKTKSGQVFRESATIIPIKNDDGEIIHLIKIAEKI
jgi:two-component system CheB/CheR fusion protein